MRTDWKDYIPKDSALKKYRQINNPDGTVSFEDATEYSQVGDKLSGKDLNELSKSAVWHLTYSNSGGTHSLTGLDTTGIVSVSFMPTANFAAGNTVNIDGVPYTIKTTNGEPAENNLFTANVPVSAIVDTNGKTINFKSGGGLSNSKLALANALDTDVVHGKKFYAGNNVIKTGNLVPYKFVTKAVKIPFASPGHEICKVRGLSFKPFLVIIHGRQLTSSSAGGPEAFCLCLFDPNNYSKIITVAHTRADDKDIHYGCLQLNTVLYDDGIWILNHVDSGQYFEELDPKTSRIFIFGK